MKITISKQTLVNGLSQAVRFIPKKAELAVLSNFLLEVDNNQMQITASNAESRFTTEIACKSDDTFRMCFPVSALDALKKLPEQPLNILSDGIKTSVLYNSGSFELSSDDPSAYPAKYEHQFDTTQVQIHSSILASGLASVVECTTTDVKTRPVFNCVSIQIVDDKISFYASDASLMGIVSYNVSGQPDTKMLVNRINALSLKSILETCDGMVTITVGNRWTDFTMDGKTISIRNMEHKAPNYRSVVPKSYSFCFSDNKSSLTDCIDRVSCFSDQIGMLKFTLYRNDLEISSQDIDFNVSAKEKRVVDADFNSKSPLSINLCASKLITVLKCIGTGDVSFDLEDDHTFVTIRPVKLQNECEKFYLVAPISKM